LSSSAPVGLLRLDEALPARSEQHLDATASELFEYLGERITVAGEHADVLWGDSACL
jgi:hypothetical protein